MRVSVLEVAVFALIAICLLAPWVRGALWHSQSRAAPDAAGAGEGSLPAERDAVRQRWAGRIGAALFTIAVMNFLAFSMHTGALGGSAANGKRIDGHYYVGAHGQYTEVTEPQWRAVWAHQVAMFVTHSLGLIVGGALLAYSQRWWGQQQQTKPVAAAESTAFR